MISVIIPAYNASAYLAECLDSVLCQDAGEETEVIVIDDGSTDDTRAIALGHEGVRVVSTPNRGLSAARNEGIRHARGEWTAFVDADDRLLPGALRLMLDAAVATRAEVVTGLLAERPDARVDADATRTTETGHDALTRTLYQERGWFNSACGKLLRTECVRKTMFTEGLYYEDLDFTARLYPTLGRICSVDTDVYYYRPNPSSFIHTFTPSRLDVLKVTEGIVARSAGDPELLKAARSRQFSANCNMYLETRRRPEYRNDARKCLEVIKQLRGGILADPRVRLKNKLGALASYLWR